MISTLYFILLISFLLWYLTSKQSKTTKTGGLLKDIFANKVTSRIVGSVLFVSVMILFIIKLGWMGGTVVTVVGIMGVGGVSVALRPFNYFSWQAVVLLYVLSLVLETSI